MLRFWASAVTRVWERRVGKVEKDVELEEEVKEENDAEDAKPSVVSDVLIGETKLQRNVE